VLLFINPADTPASKPPVDTCVSRPADTPGDRPADALVACRAGHAADLDDAEVIAWTFQSNPIQSIRQQATGLAAAAAELTFRRAVVHRIVPAHTCSVSAANPQHGTQQLQMPGRHATGGAAPRGETHPQLKASCCATASTASCCRSESGGRPVRSCIAAHHIVA
jgi:hypothetical protein